MGRGGCLHHGGLRGRAGLFYADLLEPLDAFPNVAGYLARLRARPSFARAVDEARPFRHYFPPGWPEGRD